MCISFFVSFFKFFYIEVFSFVFKGVFTCLDILKGLERKI